MLSSDSFDHLDMKPMLRKEFIDSVTQYAAANSFFEVCNIVLACVTISLESSATLANYLEGRCCTRSCVCHLAREQDGGAQVVRFEHATRHTLVKW